MTQEPNAGTQKERPGKRLMRIGLVILVIGIALIGLALGSTEVDINPVTMEMERTRNSPSPIAWVVLIAGLGLTIAGYAKRMLAAVESRN